MYKLHRPHFLLNMKRKLLSDISASSMQVIINQLCGLLVFYILSTQLTKNSFGELNWTLAVMLTVFSILSFGIDQVMVKKIAGEENSHATLAAYSMHVIVTGLLFYLLMTVVYFIFPAFFSIHNFLLLLGAGKVLLFFSSPYKQLANGMEQFRPLLLMSTVSNMVRAVLLLLLFVASKINMQFVLFVFVAGDVAEFIACLLVTKYRLHMPLFPKWNKTAYISLVKESLPQMGVVLFTSALSRFDWIFLGLFCNTIILANYSFAYKVFEVSTVPLLIIAPILIPRFTKIFKQPGNEYAAKKQLLHALLRYEIIIACVVALVLNIIWVPAVDFITQNKYGAVNRWTILLLSASMPFLYFNNFLWTISFARGDLKPILRIFFICFIVNIAGILAAVPFFSAEGAAAAYLLSVMVQSALFYHYHRSHYGFNYDAGGYLLIIAFTFSAGILCSIFLTNTLLILASAITACFLLYLLSGRITKKDAASIQQLSEI